MGLFVEHFSIRTRRYAHNSLCTCVIHEVTETCVSPYVKMDHIKAAKHRYKC
jgi:hypothetical protein